MSTDLGSIGSKLSAVLGCLMAVALLVLISASLGGRTGYLITSGNSMEPRVHQGDLVVVRKATAYEVGDAVAYRDPEIGRVFHRIVRRHGDTFVLQGDNNSWLDQYQPTQEEIMGKKWIHLPGVGKWLDRANQPLPMMMVAAMAGFLLVAPMRAANRLRTRSHRPPARRRGARAQRDGMKHGGPAGILGPDGQTVAMVVGLLACASLLLAVFSFTQPTERQTTTLSKYQQSGVLAYSASAKGGVYKDGTVETGQPIYLELVDEVHYSFDYLLTSDLPHLVSGTYQIDAVVTFDEGLTRKLPLVPETAFEGSEFSADATLTLAEVQAYIDEIAAQIGAGSASSSGHAVSIVPTIQFDAVIGNQPIDESFAPSFDFELDGLALRLAETPSDADDTSRASNSLELVEPGDIEQPTMVPATLSLLMYETKVETARQAAVAGLLLSVVAGVFLAWLYVSARSAPEPAKIQARFKPLIVKVNGSDLGVHGHIVEVASIEDLARVAEREGRMILHQPRGASHDYFVQDVDVTYHYTSVENAESIRVGVMEPSS